MDRGRAPGLAATLVAAALAAAGAFTGLFVLGIVAAALALAAAVWIVVRRPRPGALTDALVPGAPAGSPVSVDGETALPDKRFFELALASRVATARRRLWPTALILVEV